MTELPDVHTRWRCAGCGNKTRFDVVRELRVAEYWHVDLSGEPQVEESRNLAERLVSVTCRWCGRADAIELIDRAEGEAEQ